MYVTFDMTYLLFQCVGDLSLMSKLSSIPWQDQVTPNEMVMMMSTLYQTNNLTPSCCMLNRETTITNFISLWLDKTGAQNHYLTHSRGHVNHYIINTVTFFHNINKMYMYIKYSEDLQHSCLLSALSSVFFKQQIKTCSIENYK